VFGQELVFSMSVALQVNVKIHLQCLGKMKQVLLLGEASRVSDHVSDATTRTLFCFSLLSQHESFPLSWKCFSSCGCANIL